MTDWLIDINPQACPPDVMDAPEAYRAAWGRYVGEAVPGDGDPEERGARGPIGRPGCGQMVAVHLAAGDSAIEPGVGRGLADRPMV